KHAAFWRAFRGSSHGGGVGRSNFVEVMKVRIENRATHERSKNLGQQEIWNRTQLIAGRGMSRNIYTHTAKLLNQPPDFRAARRYLIGDLRPADDTGAISHQQAHDVAEPQIGGLLWPRLAVSRRMRRRRLMLANFTLLDDAGIMRASPANNKCRATALSR